MMLDFSKDGEHSLYLEGEAGQLEATLSVPKAYSCQTLAVLGHPHSLQGGSMQNKVVTTMARAFRDCGVASLRFNYRGVGQSDGVYDGGIGESSDTLAVMRSIRQTYPQLEFILAGFSFGSYVTYRAACQMPPKLLVSVAPAVHHYDYSEFVDVPQAWLVLVAESDEVVPPKAIYEWLQSVHPSPAVQGFPQTSHFFHGKLIELRASLVEQIDKALQA